MKRWRIDRIKELMMKTFIITSLLLFTVLFTISSFNQLPDDSGMKKTAYPYVSTTDNDKDWGSAIWYTGYHMFSFNADTSIITYEAWKYRRTIKLTYEKPIEGLRYTNELVNGKMERFCYGVYKSIEGEEESFVVEILKDHIIIFGHTGFDMETPITIIYSTKPE